MSLVYAIDFRDMVPFCVSVSQDSGRPEITSLQSGVLPAEVGPSALLAVAVPDEQVMVKNVTAPGDPAINLNARLYFELAQSLLEPEDQFLFDALKSGVMDRYVGLVYRRERLETLLETCGFPTSNNGFKYLARAAALGRGYQTFCRPEGGELQCIADITRTEISLCFLYRGEITSLASMKLVGTNPSSGASLKRLARELKTLVNFKLAGLVDAGITIPLAVVVATGEQVSNELFDLLSAYFPIGVASPRFNRAYLGSVEHHQPELFLPALGAAVN